MKSTGKEFRETSTINAYALSSTETLPYPEKRMILFASDQKSEMADVSSRRDSVAAKLETCVVALQNIKLDLIRLNAGSQTPQHITSLAMDATARLIVNCTRRSIFMRSESPPGTRKPHSHTTQSRSSACSAS
jgi:hypothetical protein